MVIKKYRTDDMSKGQAYTLEAIAAVTILIVAILTAQSASSVTPISSSTANENVENQHGELANGLAEAANESGDLRNTLLYWDDSNQRFHNSAGASIYYNAGVPNSEFGDIIQNNFIDNGIAVRVDLIYYERNGAGELVQNTTPYIDFGTPTSNANTASTLVELYDSDPILDDSGNETGTDLDSSTYFMENINTDSSIYNIIEVEITVWRI